MESNPETDFMEMNEDDQVDYYQIDKMSNSAMSHFKRSPLHYNFYRNTRIEPTRPMIFGNAFHTAILEDEKFSERYVELPEGAPKRPTAQQWNAKKPSPESQASMNWWLEFNAHNQEKIILNSKETQLLKNMKDALFNHEQAMEYLNEIKEAEKELSWKDDITGIEMKGKLDGFCDDFTIDLKTCITAEPQGFMNTAFNSAYHRQAALYMDGRGLSKFKKGDFYFIACEKVAPFGISIIKCGDDIIKHGRAVYSSILEDFQYWNEMGRPNVGYEWKAPVGYFTWNLPNWMK